MQNIPMCSHYQGLKEAKHYERSFRVRPPTDPGKHDLWPGYMGSFIRCHPQADVGDEAVPALEALNGLFGLVPHWATDTKLTKHTYNARSETVAEKPSFRDAWQRGQRCIIPADAIYEPDWRSGKAIATRIARKDAEPMGIAGLWSCWKSPKGDVYSYTMLTINADTHDLMRQFHKPVDEKRMVVILEPNQYTAWLNAPSGSSMDFMRPIPANLLIAAAPTPADGVLF
jgi:putative SOS response-associated peptidase YedK